jgi:hypothetical protein
MVNIFDEMLLKLQWLLEQMLNLKKMRTDITDNCLRWLNVVGPGGSKQAKRGLAIGYCRTPQINALRKSWHKTTETTLFKHTKTKNLQKKINNFFLQQ